LTPAEIGTVTKVKKESEMATQLKNLFVALGFPKPPSNITAHQLLEKLDAKIKGIVEVVGKDALGEALLKKTGTLTPLQWQQLHGINELLCEDYKVISMIRGTLNG
jgi:hypothetical protein